MATATPLRHPKQQQQTAHFYPHTAEFKKPDTAGTYATFLSSRCAYQAASSGGPEMFEVEAPAGDRLLLPAWYPEIAPNQLVVLTFSDGTTRRFKVEDAIPQGPGPNETLVGVTPK